MGCQVAVEASLECNSTTPQPMFGDMKYSQREKFFWLKSAALLDKTDLIVESLGQLDHERQEEFSAGETPKELLANLHEKTTKEYAKEISHAIASNPTQIRMSASTSTR